MVNWKQPGLAQADTAVPSGKQPRPLGSRPVSQQPWLLLVTHHEIARVLKFGDIWSFGLTHAAFGISFPGMELFLGIFQMRM